LSRERRNQINACTSTTAIRHAWVCPGTDQQQQHLINLAKPPSENELRVSPAAMMMASVDAGC
jgi:hypothetical protein